jgi:hypothetical protein
MTGRAAAYRDEGRESQLSPAGFTGMTGQLREMSSIPLLTVAPFRAGSRNLTLSILVNPYELRGICPPSTPFQEVFR